MVFDSYLIGHGHKRLNWDVDVGFPWALPTLSRWRKCLDGNRVQPSPDRLARPGRL